MKTRHILLLILSLFVLASCVQTKLRNHNQHPVKPWTIDLLVTGNPNKPFRVKTSPMPVNGCKNKADGCMVFNHDETGKITFNMMANDGGYHITQLKICKGTTPPADLNEICPLGANAWDFYVLNSINLPVIPDPLTGKIKWKYTDTVKSFVLHNRNVLKQGYYYMVIACDASDNCIKADPPMDNRGIN